ncbi:MAG: MBL fold metallo-hydrolase [Acidobacteriota bacterium]|nr:MBL fold metallo-hydrolase [Acidobacteriota bacterium]
MSKNTIATQGGAFEDVAENVRHLTIVFVNAYFISTPGAWVLVDTGLPLTGWRIRNYAEGLYGKGAKPSAIILTHGHFDHAGSVLDLANEWDVPVYAPQDPSVGGAIAQMSRVFPHGGIDLGSRVKEIGETDEIAELPDWKFIHTPGHTAGHIALFRESDRTLLAGDALATMNLDSWASNITQKKEFSEPPAPFTPDWDAARRSVEMLARLEPEVVAAGHGQPIKENAAARLKEFSSNFRRPAHGRYVNQPAIADETGIRYVPPPVADPVKNYLIAAGAAAIGGLVLARLLKRR